MNDFGFHEDSWLPFTTPFLDDLAGRSIELTNYHTNFICAPARASLLPGRYSVRTGFWAGNEGMLNAAESTLATELKHLGYRTALVGKWHLGFSSWAQTPRWRGFDYFYGYYQGFVDYYGKTKGNAFLDMHDGEDLVSDRAELDMHNTLLFSDKADELLADHAANHDEVRLVVLSPCPRFSHVRADVALRISRSSSTTRSRTRTETRRAILRPTPTSASAHPRESRKQKLGTALT